MNVEFRTGLLAQSIMAQDAAANEAVRARALAQAANTAATVVERPGEPREQTLAERRARAVAWAIRRGYAIQRPGDSPEQDWVIRDPAGGTAVIHGAYPVLMMVRPGDGADQEAAMARQEHAAMDRILRRAYPPELWAELDLTGDPSEYRPPLAGVEAL